MNKPSLLFRNKAIFLDRDGIVNELVYFPTAGIVDTPINAKQVQLNFGIAKLIHQVKELGFSIIVVSNQPAIGLNKIKEKDFLSIEKKINSLLSEKKAEIDAYYYCFHLPYAKLAKYKKDCDCRKPKIGLFKKASKELDIDLSKSWMVGDGVDDVIGGKKAGCKTILLANINSTENLRIIEKQLGNIKPDFIIKKLTDAVNIIKSNS